PTLTHYQSDGSIDGPRIAAQLQHLYPAVKGVLIPGSTGDGWDLSDQETRQLIEIALENAARQKLHLLIGALKPEASAALSTIHETLAWIKARMGESEAESALRKARVCGFAICAPRGAQLSQEEMGRAL